MAHRLALRRNLGKIDSPLSSALQNATPADCFDVEIIIGFHDDNLDVKVNGMFNKETIEGLTSADWVKHISLSQSARTC